MNEILTALKSLPKGLLEWMIFQLMLDGKIEYHDLTEMHIRHLEALRSCNSRKIVKEFYYELMNQIREERK